ncbi:MAG: sigma-54-dependent transcriptional regulator [Phycisphaerales bacterium]
MQHAQEYRVLIVDDDRIATDSIADFIESQGFTPQRAFTAEEAINLAEAACRKAQPFAAAIIDMSLPVMNGLDCIAALNRLDAPPGAVAITGYGAIPSAVEAIRRGAVEYLIKPLIDEELLVALERAIRQHVLTADNAALRQQLDDHFGLAHIIGSDERMQKLVSTMQSVANTRITVLMSGEPGTGKTLIARAIHGASPRADGPFVELACGSIPETLLERELFGHAKGAFPGAHAEKRGRFLAAHNGTLFLDEIHAASPAIQLKLLRILQDRCFEPVGSNESIEVDVRVLFGTNQPLEQMVARDEFRQDLFYRINVIAIELPPLRERRDDIPALAAHFLQTHAREVGRAIVAIDATAMQALLQYNYPGNVRELENIMERAVVLARGQRITVADLPRSVTHTQRTRRNVDARVEPAWQPMSLAEAMQEPERRIILAALRAHNWSRQQTADALAINRTTLYKKMKQYKLDRETE